MGKLHLDGTLSDQIIIGMCKCSACRANRNGIGSLVRAQVPCSGIGLWLPVLTSMLRSG